LFINVAYPDWKVFAMPGFVVNPAKLKTNCDGVPAM